MPLSGVFDDADGDSLTISASPSNDAVATVSVASDMSGLTVSARARGTTDITVFAEDGSGSAVSDTFTVTVKAAPVVASALADVSGLEAGATQEVSLSGVFSDADNDALTITAQSRNEAVATVSVADDYSSLTVMAVAEGMMMIAVTAQDADGNQVSDFFAVTVVELPGPVVGLELAATSDTVTVSWQAPETGGAPKHYIVHINPEDGGQGSGKTKTPRARNTSVTFPNLEAGQTYKVWVRAQNEAGKGERVRASITLPEAEPEQGAGQQQEQETPNQAPTVSAAIGDVTIVNESGTETVSLSGVFNDADGDSLTVAASSSHEAVATVSVASGYARLTVTAKARGTATITVTADDGNGGSASDSFTVRVKAAPVVASALADVSGLEAGDSQDVSLAGVFSDADGDTLTITARSSDDTKATVSVASDGSALNLTGVAKGTATVTVTARDSDGNRVTDTFEVSVAKSYAELIAKMKEWRNDPCCVDNQEHTDRWDRALLAFGETVADSSLTKMTAAEAQDHADHGWTRWVEVAKALKELEAS